MDQIQVLINHYAREGLFRHIATLCSDNLKKRGDDPVLLFWKAYSAVLEGSVAEGMRDLQAIQAKRDTRLACTAALIFAHNKCKLVDTESVEELQKQLPLDTKNSSFEGLLLAATFYMHSRQHEKARELVKAAQEKQDSAAVRTLFGWVDLTCGREVIASKANRHFEGALKMTEPKFGVEALVGQSRFLSNTKNYRGALEMLDQAVVLHPWFTPALLEKARMLVSMGDWEQALETTERLLAREPQNVEAMQIVILHQLTREGNYAVVATRVAELTKALDVKEPRNPSLYCLCAKYISRLAGHNPLVLQSTQVLIDRALGLANENSEYLTEAGHQALLTGNVAGALQHFKQALKFNESCVEALYGVVRCQMLSGNFEEAVQQLDFLTELHETIGKNAELLYLSGLVRWMKDGLVADSLELFTEAVDVHFRSLKNTPLGAEYYIKFDADLLLDIAKQYLFHYGEEPLDTIAPVPETLTKASKLLEIVAKAIPGHLECLFLLAKTRYFTNELDKARASVDQCLRLNPTFSDAYLLQAQLLLARDDAKRALQALDNAVSHNFKIRHNVLYYLLKARAHYQLGDLDSTGKTLEQAFELPEVRSGGGAGQPQQQPQQGAAGDKDAADSSEVAPSMHVVVSLNVLMAQLLVAQGKAGEGKQLLADCSRRFKGTPQEARVAMGQAELLVKTGDTQAALRLLSMVDSADQGLFVKAQSLMATIYLTQHGDKKNYVKCFERLHAVNPNTHTMLLLADAYTRVQEPEKSIALFEKALKDTPDDHTIARKIGQALVTTHDFSKAIEYYESALKTDSSNTALRYDLAELYTKLRRFADADRVARTMIDRQKETQLASELMMATKFFVLSATVHEGNKMIEKAVETLIKAREMQMAVLAKAKTDNPELLVSSKQLMADICFRLAEHHIALKNPQKAQAYYIETLQHNDQHKKAMLALAKLYLSRNEYDLCQHQCITMLRTDPSNEEASLMLADLMFHKGDFDAAIFHFQQLLEKRPDHYVGLERLINLLHNAGKTPEVLKFITTAEQKQKTKNQSGLNYCRGLYFRYMSNYKEALAEFNVARQDPEWANKARTQMIKLYLCEDTELFMDEDSSDKKEKKKDKDKDKDDDGSAAAATATPGDPAMSMTAGIQAAKELLSELCAGQPPVSIEHKVIECYTLILTRQKPSVEQAIATLTPLCANEATAPPAALLAISAAFMALRQAPKARNYLRRLSKVEFSSEVASELERGWLLLSHIYIQSGKFDLAQELLKQCLEHNKSCAKAWELMGFIMEKEQSYRDAADNYENAWKMLNETDPSIGYKLAFNYLKAKRYVEAISICHRVLNICPNYPKIRKEILDRARSSIRT